MDRLQPWKGEAPLVKFQTQWAVGFSALKITVTLSICWSTGGVALPHWNQWHKQMGTKVQVKHCPGVWQWWKKQSATVPAPVATDQVTKSGRNLTFGRAANSVGLMIEEEPLSVNSTFIYNTFVRFKGCVLTSAFSYFVPSLNCRPWNDVLSVFLSLWAI